MKRRRRGVGVGVNEVLPSRFDARRTLQTSQVFRMPARSLSLTRQQSAVQVQGLEVDEVAESFRNPTSQAKVVGKVEVLQAVQVTQTLWHLALKQVRSRRIERAAAGGGGAGRYVRQA